MENLKYIHDLVNTKNIANLPESVTSNLNEILSDKEVRRSMCPRLKPYEQAEIMMWSKKRHPIDEMPSGNIIKLRELHKKLTTTDNTGLRLNIRDEELLNDLNSFIHLYDK